MSVTARCLTACLLVVGMPGSATAQSVEVVAPARDRVEYSVAFISFGTGDHTNCPTGAGLAAGIQVQSRGAWLVASALELAYAGPFVCTLVLPLATFEGRIVEEWVGFRFGPRAALRVGRAITVRPALVLEPGLGAGIIYGIADFFPDDEWSLQPWISGSVAVRSSKLPFGIRLESGRMAVPVRYQTGREVVHEFRRWEHLFTLAVVF